MATTNTVIRTISVGDIPSVGVVGVDAGVDVVGDVVGVVVVIVDGTGSPLIALINRLSIFWYLSLAAFSHVVMSA